MLVPSENNRIAYNGNGSTTEFSTGFGLLDEDDVIVVLVDSDGTETIQTKTTHYTVSDITSANAAITMVTAPASGQKLILLRGISLIQPDDLNANTALDAELLEDAFARSVHQIQRVEEVTDRSLKLPIGNTSITNTTISDLGAGKFVRVNAAGTGFEAVVGAPSVDSLSDGDKGDITVSSSGAVWTIDNDAVTYDKMQNTSTTDVILGRESAGAGTIEEIACTAAGRALLDDADASAQRTTLGLGPLATASTIDNSNWSGTDLAIEHGGTGASTASDALNNLLPDQAGNSGKILSTDGSDTSWVGVSGVLSDGDKGDITVSGSGATWTIDSGAVTLSKMTDIATDTLIGRDTAGTGSPEALSTSTVKTMLSLDNVENTALSTWTGSTSLTTLGTVATGTWNGTDIAVADGGTGASTAADARTNLGLAIGTDVQAYDAGLTSIAGLTTSADKMLYTTASDVYNTTALTSLARTLLGRSSAASMRSDLGVTIGSNVQAWSTELDALSAFSSSGILTRLGAGSYEARTLTGTANQITVTDGNGAAGNPTISLPALIKVPGTSSASSEIQLSEDTDNGTHYVGLKAPDSITASFSLVLPDALPASNGKFLMGDADGSLSWSDGAVGALDDITDVVLTAPSNGEVLKYNGTNWVNAADAGGGTLDDLTDVTITTPSTGQVLKYDGSGWINDTDSGGGASAIDDLTDVTITSVSDNQFLRYDSGSAQWINETVSIPSNINDLGDVTITTPSSGQFLKYDGSGWVNDTAASANALDDLTDVVITTPSNGQVLKYNGTNWVNDSGGGGASTLDDLTDVTISSVAADHILQYDYGTSQWKNTKTLYTLSALPATDFVINLTNSNNQFVVNGNDITMGAFNGVQVENLIINTTEIETENADANLYLSTSGTGKVFLNDLAFPLTTGTNGQVLSTNGSGTLSWVDSTSATAALGDLTDVTITAPTHNGLIKYNKFTGIWEDVADPFTIDNPLSASGDATTITGSSHTAITGLSSGTLKPDTVYVIEAAAMMRAGSDAYATGNRRTILGIDLPTNFAYAGFQTVAPKDYGTGSGSGEIGQSAAQSDWAPSPNTNTTAGTEHQSTLLDGVLYTNSSTSGGVQITAAGNTAATDGTNVADDSILFVREVTPTALISSSTTVSTSVTPQNITGFSFTPAANKIYRVRCYLLASTASSTLRAGHVVASCPAGVTYTHAITSTNLHKRSATITGSDVSNPSLENAPDTGGSSNADQIKPMISEFIMRVGASVSGDVQLQIDSNNTDGSNPWTLYPGSHMTVEDITDTVTKVDTLTLSGTDHRDITGLSATLSPNKMYKISTYVGCTAAKRPILGYTLSSAPTFSAAFADRPATMSGTDQTWDIRVQQSSGNFQPNFNDNTLSYDVALTMYTFVKTGSSSSTFQATVNCGTNDVTLYRGFMVVEEIAENIEMAITISDPQDGDFLRFNGTDWTNTSITEADISDLGSYQPLDTELTAFAGLTSAADKLPYFTGSGTMDTADLTSFGRSLVDDADASTARSTLGLGTIATQASSSVSITGGSITGITDLAVADGGTGASTAAGARTNLSVREVLTANRTYYVDGTNGNDSNDGLSSGAGAFATIQKAIDVVGSLDISIYAVTISVASGTYAGITLKDPLGAGTVTIQGNGAANTTISGSSANAVTATRSTKYTLSAFKIQTSTSGSGILAKEQSNVIVGSGITFGAVVQYHAAVYDFSVIKLTSNYTISGSAAMHYFVDVGTIWVTPSITITLTGTPAFSYFAFATFGNIRVWSITFSGSATGSRYYAGVNGVIRTDGGGANYLPGDAAGSTATGGQYT